MATYYDEQYGQTYDYSSGKSTYYDEQYGQTSDYSGSSYYKTYYDKQYGQTSDYSGSSYYYDRQYGETNNYSGGYSYSDSDDEGCYISTACVKSKGFGDDCFELEILRKYRDRLVCQDNKVKQIVEGYYKTAPKIVTAIDRISDKGTVYNYIYDELVVKSISFLIDEEYEKAILQYERVFEFLKKLLQIK